MIRPLLTLLAGVALSCPAFGQGAPSDGYPPAPPIGPLAPFHVPATEHFVLANGMEVTLVQAGSVPQATLSLKIYAGGLNDARPWIADLTGDMLKEGAAGRTSGQIADAAADMGGSLSIGAGSQLTSIDTVVLSERAPDAIGLLADLARHPDFPADAFDRIKTNRARSLAVNLSQASTIANVAVARAYYGNHPYGAPLPVPAQFAGYSLDDVRHFHAANYGARRAHLYIAGRFDPAAVRAAVTARFGDWAAGPERLFLPPTPKPGPQVILVDRPGAPQSTLRLAFPGAQIGTSGDFPLQVMDTLLSGSFNSRVTRNIRENKGYTYSPGSSVNFRPDDSLWMLRADVTTAVTGAALHEIFNEIRGLQATAPGEDETAGMRTYRATDPIFSSATPGGLIGMLSNYDTLRQPPSYIANFVPNALAVTPAQISDSARATLPLDRMTLVVVGDLKTVVPQLKAQPELAKLNFQTVTVP